MMKVVALLFALTILVSAGGAGRNGLTFQLGNNLAALTRSGSNYNGVLTLGCQGGSGAYSFALSGLPSGWAANDNSITIPNIVNVIGTYVIRAKVTDLNTGLVLEGDISLVINGVNVVIQSSAGNNDNNIQFSVGGGVVTGGAPGSDSGSPAGGAPGSGSPAGGAPGSGAPGSGAPGSGAPGSGAPGSGAPGSGAPGSGAPGSGAPGSGSPAGGAPGSGSPVAPLYENYPGLPSGSTPSAPAGGRYPTGPSPTGNPSTPNIVPSVISSAQAPYVPSRDSRAPTVDDIKRNAAFNRQLNAGKAIANLLSIIQQLTANVNAAKNDVTLLEDQLKAADSANNDCNNKIYDLSNTRTKILNAIRDRQDRISEANRKIRDLTPIIDDLTRTRDNLINKRTQIENTRSPNSAKLADLEKQLKDCGNTQTKLQKQIDDLNAQISGLNNDLKKTKDDAASAPGAIDLIDQQVPIIDSRIADLKKQLDDAQKEKAKLLQDKLKYQQIIDDANRKARDLQRNIDDLTSRIPGLLAQLAAQLDTCSAIQRQLDDLRNQISQKESDYKVLVDQIKAQDGLINDKKAEVKRISDGIANLPNEISALQAELARTEESIRRQYYICNDAADSVRKAKQNLDALNTKFTTESGWLRDANANLEKARAEKELADQGVQEIIAASTSALPFAIVPNGLGNTPAGSPAGNNPSGSPLGPVADSNQVAPGSPVVVGDLSSYLSQAYGAGVDPTKPSTVTTLYPISGLTLQALTGQSSSGVFNPDGTFVTGGFSNGANSATTFPVGSQPAGGVIVAGPGAPGVYGGGKIPTNFLSSFSCNGGSGLTQGSGQVVAVQPGQIVVSQNNGAQVTLKVAPCSNMNAVQRNYAIVPRTRVYYKGV